MTGFNFVLAAFVIVASTFFLAKRGLRYLRFLQQEGYNGGRFLDWYKRDAAYDRYGSIAVLIGAFIVFIVGYTTTSSLWIEFLTAAVLLIIGISEPDPRVYGKLPLKMTSRATRIFSVYLAIVCVSLLFSYFISSSSGLSVLGLLLFQIFLFQLSPFFVLMSNKLLDPYEQRLQKKFLTEAKNHFKKVAPFVIGITGSYGKTSTKNILGQLLNGSLGSTFWPQKGINTPMGITRSIRTELTSDHKYAVVEMGAYHIGSIKRLCDLTPPKAAIITAVGIMHLDRFAGESNIYQAKSELAAAVPEDGILICNGDNSGARRMASEFPKKTTLLYGLDESLGGLDCIAKDIRTTESGTEFRLIWQGQEYRAMIPLLGLPAVSNCLASFTLACTLGVKPEYVVAMLSSLDQVENRLFLDKQGEITYLRDAYNSNPIGFASALDVLKEYPAKRRILVTPGMIELGDKQYEENRLIGRYAASICDLVYLVGPTNKDALMNGLVDGKADEDKVKYFSDRSLAFAALAEEQLEGDVVLIENDLPDVLETKERF